MVGAWVSWTVTVNDPSTWRPAASSAKQETPVAPTLKLGLAAGVHPDEITPTASVGANPYETLFPVAPVASTVMFPGRFSCGGVVS